jgi:hypothetical protein
MSQLDLLRLCREVGQAVDGGLKSEALAEGLGQLIDAAGDARCEQVLVCAIELSERIVAKADAVNACLALYHASNAWSSLLYLRHAPDALWSFEQPELLQQILALRRAIRHPGFSGQPPFRRAQIYCNLGNALNHAGRFIDALTEWRLALLEQPILGMARGNLGIGLATYGRSLYDSGNMYWFLRAARQEFMTAIVGGVGRDRSTFPEALQGFSQYLLGVEHQLSLYGIADDETLGEFSLGKGKREQRYRRWCLDRTLFLNPMNDLGPDTVAAYDTLSVPSHRVEGAGITYRAFFNQLVQEYTYARWCLFQGSTADSLHFADRGVGLAYNADLTHYSIGAEQVKTAFRCAYSLLDKVAYFINKYWDLGVEERNVYFHSIWYEDTKGKMPRMVRAAFETSENLPLRGLFWLAKDIFDPGMQTVASPVAKQLKALRNHLEHKFVKVVAVNIEVENESELFQDHLAHRISRDELVDRSEHILKLSRSALIYLSMAMHVEERRKLKDDGVGKRGAMDMGLYPDDLKV